MDYLSSEYGWTTKEILELTLYEINWRIDAIMQRLNMRTKFEMFCHQIEFEGEEGTDTAERRREATPQQQEAMDRALIEAKKRKAIEFQSRKRNV